MRSDETRILRDRQSAFLGSIDRAQAGGPTVGAARQVVQVYDGGAQPKTGDHYFLCHPCVVGGVESEGATPEFECDADSTIPVAFLRTTPGDGDFAVAVLAGGRWVAEKTGTPTPGCRWICGPFAVVSGDGSGGLVAITVSDSGSIASSSVAQRGSGYTQAKTTVVVSAGIGSGAVLSATVSGGELVGVDIVSGGSGYLDNAAPDHLDLTVACPAWTASLRLDRGTLGVGFTPTGTAQGGTLPFCIYGGTTTVDVPAGPLLPSGILAMNVGARVAFTSLLGWALMVSVGAQHDGTTTVCHVTNGCGDVTVYGLQAGAYGDGQDFNVPQGDGPLEAMALTSCTSRPYSFSTTLNPQLLVGGCTVSAQTGWYLLGGGGCSTSGSVPFTFTLTEPPPS